jgi:hypothetical protein
MSIVRNHNFKPGDRVVVVRTTSQFYKKHGLVVDLWGYKIRVAMDGTSRILTFLPTTLKLEGSMVAKDTAEARCKTSGDHAWQNYHGFTHDFQFCKNCDCKRPMPT